jgi:hypothetical protein
MAHDDQVRSGRRAADIFLITGFLSILSYPAISVVRSREAAGMAPPGENRVLAARPPLTLLTQRPHRFARAFKAFFDDQFEARDRLVQLNSLVRYRVLRASSNPSVIPGKHGALFYAGEPTGSSSDMGNEMVLFRRTHPLTEAELESLGDLLERRRTWAASLGARFLFVIAPDKSTVYADQLPDRFNCLDGPSSTDQIVDYLAKFTRVDVVDLRGKLIEARRKGPVYHLRDTHWNDYGAFAGYRALAERLHDLIPREELLELDGMEKTGLACPDDLTRMLNLKEQLAATRVVLKPMHARSHPIPFPLDSSPVPTWLGPPLARRREGSKLPKALVYHDSFLYQMMPFLSEHFETAIYIRDPHVTLKTIQDYHPDIVIHECVERLVRSLVGLHDDLRPEEEGGPIGSRAGSRAHGPAIELGEPVSGP